MTEQSNSTHATTPADDGTDELPADAALAARAREVRTADHDDLTPLDDL